MRRSSVTNPPCAGCGIRYSRGQPSTSKGFRNGAVSCTLLAMTRAQFERLVRQALTDIPDEIEVRLENVDIVVEEWATDDQLVGANIPEDQHLLGLYEGIPLPDRYNYDMVLPDKITLFQRTIEEFCAREEEIVEEVRMTVVHALAHHFGIDAHRLEEIGV